MENIILIGGAPTAGKSFVTRKLSEELSMPWISTDAIREVMRQIVRKKDYPELFYYSNHHTTAEKYLTKHTPDQIVMHQNKESVEVWKGIRALIDTDYNWKSFIVEGIAILPNLVARFYKKDKMIKPIFLVNSDREWIRKVVFTRGLWDDAWKYPDSVKEKEVEWALKLNAWIKKEAKKYKYPIYEIKNNKISIPRLIKLVR